MRKYLDRCLECGLPKAQHHVFERTPCSAPRGCVCEPLEWGSPPNIGPLCKNFVPMRDYPEACTNCEHDLACHSGSVSE